MKKAFGMLFMLPLVRCKIQSFPDEISSRESLTNCMSSASSRFFMESDILTMSLTTSEVDKSSVSATVLDKLLLANLFSGNNFTLLLVKPSVASPENHFIKKADSYIMQIRNDREVYKNLKNLKTYKSWNPYAKFAVISAAPFAENNFETAARIVKALWIFKITNAVVLLPDPTNISVYNVLSWFPYKGGKCGIVFEEVELIDNCTFGNFSLHVDWYPNKIPKDLHHCQVKVRTIVWPPFVDEPSRKIPETRNQYEFENGIEIKLMNTVAKAANFFVNYTVSDLPLDWGKLFRNGTSSGMMKSLMDEDVDVGLCALGATVTRHNFLDASETYIQEAVTFCVPHGWRVSTWKKIVTVLQFDTWIMCFLCIILISVTSVSLSYFEKTESSVYKNVLNCLQNTVTMITGSPVKTPPRSGSVRLVFMLWIIFCLHLNIVYRTTLISFLTSPSYETELSSAEEILRSNLTIYTLPNFKRFFSGSEDPTSMVNMIKKKWINCNDMKWCLDKVALERNSVMLTPRLYMEYIINRYKTKNGDPLMHCFKDSIVTFPVEMLMGKGFHLKNRIKVLISRIVPSGLIPMWTKTAFEHSWKETVVSDSRTGEKLTMRHLQAIFIIYGICCIFAVALFAIEICVFKYRKTERKFKRTLINMR